ncbi:hypothetical protein V8C34DRAFT_319219 [Trichoderma compactum]
MTSITKLPCEVMTSVMRNLGSVRFLLPCLLTCRYFYSCFKENPGVAADILEHRLKTLSVALLTKLGTLHEAVHSMTTQFSKNAWAHILNDQGSRTPHSLSLSPTEYYRFCRAFYRFELYCNLFRSSMPSNIASFSEDDRVWFFAQHAPWENEQLGNAHDFLELQLFKDVLAHDVEFSEWGVDYLTVGSDNDWRQLWLSQGIYPMYKMVNETSYEAKKALLGSPNRVTSADLFDALTILSEEDLDDDGPLAEYTNEELETLYPTSHAQDTDKGPFEAWRVAFNCLPRSDWSMLANNSGLRERAYVLWDLDRLKRCDLLELFENTPNDSEFLKADKDFDGTDESFEERSNI